MRCITNKSNYPFDENLQAIPFVWVGFCCLFALFHTLPTSQCGNSSFIKLFGRQFEAIQIEFSPISWKRLESMKRKVDYKFFVHFLLFVQHGLELIKLSHFRLTYRLNSLKVFPSEIARGLTVTGKVHGMKAAKITKQTKQTNNNNVNPQ